MWKAKRKSGLASEEEFFAGIEKIIDTINNTQPGFLGEVRIIRKGETTEEECMQGIVKNSNKAYYNIESDALQGNWLFLTAPGTHFTDKRRFYVQLCLDDFKDEVIETGNWETVIMNIMAAADKIYQASLRVGNQSLFDAVSKEIMPNLIVRLVPLEMIEKLQVVHSTIGDVAVVPCAMLVNDGKNLVTRYIPLNELDRLETTADKLIDLALQNMSKKFPPSFGAMPGNGKGVHLYQEISRKLKVRKIGITNRQMQYGATAILYSGVMQKLYEVIGDYWLLFANEDEVHVFPKDKASYQELSSIIPFYEKTKPDKPPVSKMVYSYIPGKGLVPHTAA